MDQSDDVRLLQLQERLALAGASLEASSQRLDEVRDHLTAIRDEIRNSRNQRDTLRHAPFADLEALLDTLPVIEQAKGILMARAGCSAAEALEMLR